MKKIFEIIISCFFLVLINQYAQAVQCQPCNGTGKVDCSICGGTGRVTCLTCLGTKKIICNTCGGDGTVDCGNTNFTAITCGNTTFTKYWRCPKADCEKRYDPIASSGKCAKCSTDLVFFYWKCNVTNCGWNTTNETQPAACARITGYKCSVCSTPYQFPPSSCTKQNTCGTCLGNKTINCPTCNSSGNGDGKVPCTATGCVAGKVEHSTCAGTGKVPPNPPANLRVISDGGTGNQAWVSLAWDKNNQAGVNGYFVIYATFPGITPENYTGYASISGQNTITYTYPSLTAGQHYYFIVTTSDTDELESVASDRVEAYPGSPAKPTGLLCASADNGNIVLRWSDNPENDLGTYRYTVFWNTAGTSNQSQNAFSSNSTISSLTNGKNYTIWVTANDKFGNISPASDSISATPFSMGAAPQKWPIATTAANYNRISHTFGEVNENNLFTEGIVIDPAGSPNAVAVLDGEISEIGSDYITLRHRDSIGSWISRKTKYSHISPRSGLSVGSPVYAGMELGVINDYLFFQMGCMMTSSSPVYWVNPLYNNTLVWELMNVPGYPSDIGIPIIKNAYLKPNSSSSQIGYYSPGNGITEEINDWCRVSFNLYNQSVDSLYVQGDIALIANAVDSKVNADSGSQGDSVTVELLKYQIDNVDKYIIEFDALKPEDEAEVDQFYHLAPPCETEQEGENDFIELFSLDSIYLFPNKTQNSGIWQTTGYSDGNHNLTIYSEDAYGNSVAETINVRVDNFAPTGNIFINSGAAYTNNPLVTLTLDAQDPGSGVDGMRISNYSNFSDNPAWEIYSVSKSNWPLLAGMTEGTKTVYVQYQDIMGHISTFSRSIILDMTPPTGSLIIKDHETGKTDFAKSRIIDLYPNSWDINNGIVAQMRFSNDGITFAAWQPYSLNPTSWTLTSGDGQKTVWVQYKDAAGNISQSVINASIILDTIPPDFSVKTLNPTAISEIGQNVTFTYQPTEISSVKITIIDSVGTEKIVLKPWGDIYPTSSYSQDCNGIISSNGEFELLRIGTYAYKVELIDRAGNYYSAFGNPYYRAEFQMALQTSHIICSLETLPNSLGNKITIPWATSGSQTQVDFKSNDPRYPGLIVARARESNTVDVPKSSQLQVVVTKPGYVTQPFPSFSSMVDTTFVCSGFMPCVPGQAGFDPDVDSDNDGIPDGWEYSFWINWSNWNDHCGCDLSKPDRPGFNPNGALDASYTYDYDNDGLNNFEEYKMQYDYLGGYSINGLNPQQKDIVIQLDWMVSSNIDYQPNPLAKTTTENVFAQTGIKVHWVNEPQSHAINISSYPEATNNTVTKEFLQNQLISGMRNYGNFTKHIVHAIFAPGWTIVEGVTPPGKAGAGGIYFSPGVPPDLNRDSPFGVYVFDMHTRNVSPGRIENMGTSPELDKYEGYILSHEIGHALGLDDVQ